jgi:hypothetical protein
LWLNLGLVIWELSLLQWSWSLGFSERAGTY